MATLPNTPHQPFSAEYLAYNNSPHILSLVCSFSGLSLAVVLLRVYIRTTLLRAFGSDDVVMVFCTGCLLGVMVCMVKETHHGIGRYVDTISPSEFKEMKKLIFAHVLLMVTGISFIKISVGLFLLRLAHKQTRYRLFLKSTMVFTILFWLACLGTLIFQCIPAKAAWDKSIKNAKCYSTKTFTQIGLFNSSINIATDFIFATVPIPLIWKLQLNTRTKLSLVAILSLGYVASAAATVKAVKQYRFFKEKDWTTKNSFHVWNLIEFSIGIIAASLPCLKPLFSWFLETARGYTSNSCDRPRRNQYGSNYRISALGYIKHGTATDRSTVALKDLPASHSGADSGTIKGSYDVSCEGGMLKSANREGHSRAITWINEDDNNSDESILPQSPLSGIMKTTEAEITR